MSSYRIYTASALRPDSYAQLYVDGPAFQSHAIDIGDVISEIDGA